MNLIHTANGSLQICLANNFCETKLYKDGAASSEKDSKWNKYAQMLQTNLKLTFMT